ncbi:MAG: rod shape-determining protein MreC [Oligoflexia bacterium]|nr:rod shape-determining protein MreC [Oligoflexia bacterium]
MFGLFEMDIKKLLLIVLILALPLISLNIEKKQENEISWYDLPVLWVINPTQELFSKFALGVSKTTSFYLNLLDVKKQNRILKEELARAKQDLKLAEETQNENNRLKKILEFKQSAQSQYLAAQVTAMGLWGEYSSVTINKGLENGVKKKMAVVTPEGVVGYILNAEKKYSTVILLTDRNTVIDAIVQKNRARGILEGLGKDLSQLKYLLRTDDIQVNDLVVASGLDGLFPKGFPIGYVTRVDKKHYGVTQYVEVKPIIDITRLEEVLVVKKNE